MRLVLIVLCKHPYLLTYLLTMIPTDRHSVLIDKLARL